MSDFGEKLGGLCAKEVSAGRDDNDRMAEVIERLTHSLAFTIAVHGEGDPATIDKLIEGAVSYLYECATDLAGLGSLAALARRASR